MEKIKITADAQELSDLTVRDLVSYSIELVGAPLEVEEISGEYEFKWRGCNYNSTFRGDKPASDLVARASTLASMYDNKSGRFVF